MRYSTAIEHYGSVESLRKAFRPPVSHQAVYRWGLLGVVPKARALELERATSGRLRLDPALYYPSRIQERKEREARRLAAARAGTVPR